MEKSKNLKIIYTIYFIMLIAFIGLRIASAFGGFSWINNAFLKDGVATIIIQIFIMFLLPILLIFLFKKKGFKKSFEFVKLKKISWKAVLIAVLIGIIVFFLNLFIASFFSFIIKLLGYNPEGTSSGIQYSTFLQFLYGIVFVGVLPGFCEEFMHRGIVLQGTKDSVGYKRAIIISSVLFGLTHLNVEQFFYATILGLIMGFITVISDNIIPAMIVHFMNNAINVYFSYAKNTGLPGSNFNGVLNSVANNNPIIWFVVCVLIIALSLFLLLWLTVKLFRETKLKKLGDTFNRLEKDIKGDETEKPLTDLEVVKSFELFVFPHIKEADTPLNIMIPVTEADTYKPDLKTNLLFYASLFLGILITVFTFIWGMIW